MFFLNCEKGFDVVWVKIGSSGFMHEATSIDDQGAVGDIDHETDDLFRDENGERVELLDFAKGFCDVLDDGGLDAFGWFVEEQNLWFCKQGATYGELLLLSTREVSGFALAHLVQYGEKGVDLVQRGS